MAVDLAWTTAHLVVAALGTRACYLANGGSSGRDFLNRFISLGWVVGVRIALALAVPLALRLDRSDRNAGVPAARCSDVLLLAALESDLARSCGGRDSPETPLNAFDCEQQHVRDTVRGSLAHDADDELSAGTGAMIFAIALLLLFIVIYAAWSSFSYPAPGPSQSEKIRAAQAAARVRVFLSKDPASGSFLVFLTERVGSGGGAGSAQVSIEEDGVGVDHVFTRARRIRSAAPRFERSRAPLGSR
jgi:hypothetical protein